MTYTVAHLDPGFTAGNGKKLAQYRDAGCLPASVQTNEALVCHLLQLLTALHPALAEVLDVELLSGNRVRTVFSWPEGPFCVSLLRPFTKRHKGANLDRSRGKDPHYGPASPAIEQYSSPLAPGQYLAADIK
ncbi:hypothetical protein [Chitinophaga rhizosphaerae]|uniref:hypothetical protein n=1 Tax=Chitinophaga rhizosphaerae TaxID=1864947 RepID=UPI000F815565|nr:hypothetical protein [Chitinophaga rhizosphaerae]